MLIEADAEGALLGEGFPGQRMNVVPRPRVEQALARPVTRALVVTDCGYFPHAEHHGRTRPTPIRQLVVIVCVRGRGWCETAEARFDVEAGQMMLLPPGVPHSYGADPADPWTLWWVHVDGTGVADFLTLAGLASGNVVRTVPDMYATISLLSEITAWMERDSTDSSLLRAAGAAWHLLSSVTQARAVSLGGNDSSIERAASYLREHVHGRVDIRELASMAGMSPSYFAARFKQLTGSPPIAYQTQARMASARTLLDTTARSINDISQAVGYADSFYFARQFKKIHGMSPSVYRRQGTG